MDTRVVGPSPTRLFSYNGYGPTFWFAIPGPSSADSGSCVFVWSPSMNRPTTDTFTLFDEDTQTVIADNIPHVTNVLFSNYVGLSEPDLNKGLDIAGFRNAGGASMMFRIKNNPNFLPGRTYTIGIGSSQNGQRPNSGSNYGTITVTLPPYLPPVSLYNVNTYLPNNLISANDAKAVLLWNQPSFSTNPSTSYTITNASNGVNLAVVTPKTDSPFTVSVWETNSYETDTATSSAGFIDASGTLWMIYRLDTTAPSTTSLNIISSQTQPIQYTDYTNIPNVNNITISLFNPSNTVIVNVPAPGGAPAPAPAPGPAPAPFPSPEIGLAQDPIVLPSLGPTSLPTNNALFSINNDGPIIAYALTGTSSLNYASCVFELQSSTGISTADTYIIKNNDTTEVIATFPHVTNIPFNYNVDYNNNRVDNNPTLDIAGVRNSQQNRVMFRLKNNAKFLPGRTYNLVIGSSIHGQNRNYGSITVITPVYIPPVQLYSVENSLPSNLISPTDPKCVLLWAQPNYTNMQFASFTIRETATNNVLANVSPQTYTIFDVSGWISNTYSEDPTTNNAGYVDASGTLWMMYRLTSNLTNTSILNLRIESAYSQQMYTSNIKEDRNNYTYSIQYPIISVQATGASNIVTAELTTTALTAPILYSVDNSLPSNLIKVSATETEAVLIWNQKLTMPNSAANIIAYVIVNADGEIIDSVTPVTDSTFDVAAWKTNPYTADTTTNAAGFIDANNMNWMLYRIRNNSSFIRGSVYNIKIQTWSTSSTYSNVVRAVLPYATLPPVSVYNEQDSVPSNLMSPTAGGAILIWSQFILNANDLLDIVSYNIIDVTNNTLIASVSPIINKPFVVADWQSNPYITDLSTNSAGFIDGNTLWMMYRVKDYSSWNFDNVYHIRIQTITSSVTNIYSDDVRVKMPDSAGFNPVEIYASDDGSLPANLIAETGETLVIWKQPSFINSSKQITYDITISPVSTSAVTAAESTPTFISGTLLNKSQFGPRLVAAIPGPSSSNYGSCAIIWLPTGDGTVNSAGGPVTEKFTLFDKNTGVILATNIPFVRNISFNATGIRNDDINTGVDIAGYYVSGFNSYCMLFRIKNNPLFLAGNTYNIGVASSFYGQCIDSPIDYAFSTALVSLPPPFYSMQLQTLNYSDLQGRLILIWAQPKYDSTLNVSYDVCLDYTVDNVSAITNQPFDIEQLNADLLSSSIPEKAGYIDDNGTLWMLYRTSRYISSATVKCRVLAQSINYYNTVLYNIPVTNSTAITYNSNVISFNNNNISPRPPSSQPVKISGISPILNSPFDVSLWKSNTVYYPSTTNTAGFVDAAGTLWMLYRITNQPLLAIPGNKNTLQITTNLPDATTLSSGGVIATTPAIKPAPAAASIFGEYDASNNLTLSTTLIAPSTPEIVLMWTQVSMIGEEPKSYMVVDTISNTILVTVAPVYNIPFDIATFSMQRFFENKTINIAGTKVVDGNVTADMLLRIKNNPLLTGGRSYNLVIKTVGSSYKIATSSAIKLTLVDNINSPTVYSDVSGYLPTNLVSDASAEAVFIWSQYLPDKNSLSSIYKFRISKSFSGPIAPVMIEEIAPVTNASFDLNTWKNGAYTRDTTTNTLGYIDTPTKTLWMMHRCKKIDSVYKQTIVIQTVSSSSQTNTSNVVTVALPKYKDLSPTLYNVNGIIPSNFISNTELEAIFIWSQPLLSPSVSNIASYSIVNTATGEPIDIVSPVISPSFDIEAWKTQPYTTDISTTTLGIIIDNTHWMMHRVRKNKSVYNAGSFNSDSVFFVMINTLYNATTPVGMSNTALFSIPTLPYPINTLFGLFGNLNRLFGNRSAVAEPEPVGIVANIYSSSGSSNVQSYYFTNELTIPFIYKYMVNTMLKKPGYTIRKADGYLEEITYGEGSTSPFIDPSLLYWRKCLSATGPYNLQTTAYNSVQGNKSILYTTTSMNIPGSVLYIAQNIPDYEPTVPSPNTVYDNYAYISAERIGVGGLPTIGAGAGLPLCLKRFYSENAPSPALVSAGPGVYFTEDGSMLGLLSPYNYDISNGITITVPAAYTTIIPNRFPTIPVVALILPFSPLNHPGMLSPNAYYRDNSLLPVYSPVNYPGGGKDVAYEADGIGTIDPELATVSLPPCDIQYFNGHYGFNGAQIALNTVDALLTTDVLPILELVDVSYKMKDITSFVNTLNDGQLFSYGGVTYSNNQGRFPTIVSVNRPAINLFSSYQITNAMFQDNTTITSVGILDYNGPNMVKTVAGYAFNRCTNLVTIDTRFKFTDIQDYAFAGCTSFKGNNIVSPTVTKLTLISTDATTIGRGAFSNCTALTDVSVSSGGALNIGPVAFGGCIAITDLRLNSSGILSIENTAFVGCAAITSMTITSAGNFMINTGLFSSCSALTTLSITCAGSLSISPIAFLGCSSLTQITLNAATISLAADAFTGCDALTSVSLIASDTLNVDTSPFTGCTGLTSITANVGSISILSNLFLSCSALTTVSLKCTGTLQIDDGAFAGRSLLTNVTLDANTLRFSASSFATNTNIQNFTLKGSNIQSTDNSNLNSLILPFVASLVTIHIEGPLTLEFATSSPITNLQSLWINITNLIINCGSSNTIFNNLSQLQTVYAPKISAINVAAAPATNIVLFNNCSNLRSVTVSSTYACNYTFSTDNYSNLTTVAIDTPNLAVNTGTMSNSPLTNLSLKTISRFGTSTNIDINAELLQSRATITRLSLSLGNSSFSFASSLQQFTALTNVRIEGATVSLSTPAGFFAESSSSQQSSITDLYLPGSFISSVTNTTFFSSLKNATFTNISSSTISAITTIVINNSLTNQVNFIFSNDITSAHISTVLQYFIGKQIKVGLVVQPSDPTTVYNINADDLVSNRYVTLTANVNMVKLQNTVNLAYVASTNSYDSTIIINGNATIPARSFENIYRTLKLTINGNATVGDNCFSLQNNRFIKWCTQGIASFLCTGVANIGAEAFLNCTGLQTVSIGSGSVGDRAFMNSGIMNMSKLTSTIGIAAFFGCERLTSVSMQEGLTSVGDFAFVNTGIIGEMVFPSTIVSLGRSYIVNCPKVTKVTYKCPVVFYKDPTLVYNDLYDCIDFSNFSSVDIHISGKSASVEIGGDNNTFTYKNAANTSITVPVSSLYKNVDLKKYKNRITAYKNLLVKLKALYNKFEDLSVVAYNTRPKGPIYTYPGGRTIQLPLSDYDLDNLKDNVTDAISSAREEGDSAINIYDSFLINQAPISALAAIIPTGQEFTQLYTAITTALAACVAANNDLISPTQTGSTILVATQYDMPLNSVINETLYIPYTNIPYTVSTPATRFTHTCTGSRITDIAVDDVDGATTITSDASGNIFSKYTGISVHITIDASGDDTYIQINDGSASVNLSSLINPNLATVICYLSNLITSITTDSSNNITSAFGANNIDYTFAGYVTSIKSLMNCENRTIKINSDSVYIHKMAMSGHTNTYVDISAIALVIEDHAFMSLDNSAVSLNLAIAPVVGKEIFMDSTAFRLTTNKDLLNIPPAPIFSDINANTIHNLPTLLPSITGISAEDITDIKIEHLVHGSALNNPIFAITFKQISTLKEITVISQPQDWFWCYLLNAAKSNYFRVDSLSNWNNYSFSNPNGGLNHYQLIDELRPVYYDEADNWYSFQPYETGLANNFAVNSFTYKGKLYNRTTSRGDNSNVRLKAVFSTLRSAYDASWTQYGMLALEVFSVIIQPIISMIPGAGVAINIGLTWLAKGIAIAVKAIVTAIRVALPAIGRAVTAAAKFIGNAISKITTRLFGRVGKQTEITVVEWGTKAGSKGANVSNKIVSVGSGSSKAVKATPSFVKNSTKASKSVGKCLKCTLGATRNTTASSPCALATVGQRVADNVVEDIAEAAIVAVEEGEDLVAEVVSSVKRVSVTGENVQKSVKQTILAKKGSIRQVNNNMSAAKKRSSIETKVSVVSSTPTTFVTKKFDALRSFAVPIDFDKHLARIAKKFVEEVPDAAAATIPYAAKATAKATSRLVRSNKQASRGLVQRVTVVTEPATQVVTVVPKTLAKLPARPLTAVPRRASDVAPAISSARTQVVARKTFGDPRGYDIWDEDRFSFFAANPIRRRDIQSDYDNAYTSLLQTYFSSSSASFNIDQFKVDIINLFAQYAAPAQIANAVHLLDYLANNISDSLAYLAPTIQNLASIYGTATTSLSQLSTYMAVTNNPLVAGVNEASVDTNSVFKFKTDIEGAYISSIDAKTPPYIYPTASPNITFNSEYPANDFAYYATAGCINQPDEFVTNNRSHKNGTLSFANPLLNMEGYMFNGTYLDRETGIGPGVIGSDGVVDVISQEGANSGVGGYENQQLLFNKWYHIYLGKRNVNYTVASSSVSNHAFAGSLGMNLVIPEGVVDISDYAYCATDGSDGVVPFVIVSVTFPSTLRTIGKYAFANTHIQTCNIPQNVTSVGVGAFKNSLLSSVNFGWIPPNARGIKSRDANTDKTSLDDNAFEGCALESINLNNISSVGQDVFTGNPIQQVIFSDALPSLDASFVSLLNDTNPEFIAAPEYANDITSFLTTNNIDTELIVDPALSYTAGNGGSMVYTWAFIQSIINNTPTPNSKYVSWLVGGVAPGGEMLNFHGDTLTVNNLDSTPQYVFSRVQALDGTDVSSVSVENTDNAQYKTGWICTWSDNGIVPLL